MEIKWADLRVGDKLEYNVNFIAEIKDKDHSLYEYFMEHIEKTLTIKRVKESGNTIEINVDDGDRSLNWSIDRLSGQTNYDTTHPLFDIVELV